MGIKKNTQLLSDSLDPCLPTAGTFRGKFKSALPTFTLQQLRSQPLNFWHRQLIKDQTVKGLIEASVQQNDESSSDGERDMGSKRWDDKACLLRDRTSSE